MSSEVSDGHAPIAGSDAEWGKQIERLAQTSGPSFFHLRARLPKQGRTNQVLGASKCMTVVLKTYASGGENELHAHANEDHLFVILQGRAVFHGPRGETREVARNDCVLIPTGALYWFVSSGDEPLVMLRIGAVVDSSKDVMARVDAQGQPFDGYSAENKELPLVLDEHRVFE
jgi:mannose-6-phosphate isomerase-like protein (cupin superfamily)